MDDKATNGHDLCNRSKTIPATVLSSLRIGCSSKIRNGTAQWISFLPGQRYKPAVVLSITRRPADSRTDAHLNQSFMPWGIVAWCRHSLVQTVGVSLVTDCLELSHLSTAESQQPTCVVRDIHSYRYDVDPLLSSQSLRLADYISARSILCAAARLARY